MKDLLRSGRLIFCLGLIGLSVLCFIDKDFIVGRPPAGLVGTTGAYITGGLLLLACLGILFRVKPGICGLLIAVLLLALSVIPHLFRYLDDWPNTYKSMALFGGALIVSHSFLNGNKHYPPTLGKVFIVVGSLTLAAFFIASGYAHFKFHAFVADFIPSYLPFHEFWAYFCGVCLIAGGVGLLISRINKWAALLCGIMVAGWFLLLHIPRFLNNVTDISDRMGLFESFTFVGIFFVLYSILNRAKAS